MAGKKYPRVCLTKYYTIGSYGGSQRN